MRRRWVFAVLAAGAACAAVGRADSIWARRDPRYAFLFQDNRARNIGDVLIVTVSETTVSNAQDARNLNRTTNSSGQVQFFGTAPTTSGGTGTGAAIPGTAFAFPAQQTSQAFSGSSQQTTNHVFTDRIAVTVVDMMPNGNLVVEGYRSRVVEGEERVLRITGVVRQQDVGVGNIVPSQSVANFRISYLGRGPGTRTTTRGPIARFASWIWPF
jgi:flagellar L-ring protein precursor FlgH